jgi:adenosylcobinamide-GDP ribazoletransferase
MRDSRIGAYGVLALAVSVGIRAAALGAFETGSAALLTLVAAGALSRGALPVVMVTGHPARADGLAASVGRPENWTAGTAAVLGIAIALLVLGPKIGFLALIGAAAAAAIVTWIVNRKIEGYTGDTLGATQQSVETTVLVIAAAAA